MTPYEAMQQWQRHQALLATKGFIAQDAKIYMTEEMKTNYALAAKAFVDNFGGRMAFDAIPGPLSTAPNSALPMILTTFLDPELVRVVFGPLAATKIIDERKIGDWTMDTYMIPVVESTGEVSSYGDFAENGRAGVNMNFPQRQSYHFQVIAEYGERELERAGLAKLSYVAEIDAACAESLNRFSNYSYFFGIQGLQNYGLLNDPSLPVSITPGNKAAGGTKWITGNGIITATPNEIYADIQALFYQLVYQSSGLIKADDKMVIALPNTISVALSAANSFNVHVRDLLKSEFPNIRFEQAPQYGAVTSVNPVGIAAGNMVQLIAETFEGKKTAFCGFTEKMRTHKTEVRTSSFKQKKTSGTWGAILRYPVAIASMVGI